MYIVEAKVGATNNWFADYTKYLHYKNEEAALSTSKRLAQEGYEVNIYKMWKTAKLPEVKVEVMDVA